MDAFGKFHGALRRHLAHQNLVHGLIALFGAQKFPKLSRFLQRILLICDVRAIMLGTVLEPREDLLIPANIIEQLFAVHALRQRSNFSVFLLLRIVQRFEVLKRLRQRPLDIAISLLVPCLQRVGVDVLLQLRIMEKTHLFRQVDLSAADLYVLAEAEVVQALAAQLLFKRLYIRVMGFIVSFAQHLPVPGAPDP